MKTFIDNVDSPWKPKNEIIMDSRKYERFVFNRVHYV